MRLSCSQTTGENFEAWSGTSRYHSSGISPSADVVCSRRSHAQPRRATRGVSSRPRAMCPAQECMTSTVPPILFRKGCLPCPVSELHANLGAAGLSQCTVARRNMRALGILLVPLGLAVAAFAVRPGDTLDDAAASRPIGASAAVPTAPISQTVYVPMRRAAAPIATAGQELPRTSNLDLVGQLQHELKRVGCYEGGINGIWIRSTRRAMEALIDQLNAKLPTARPELVHLALVQGQHARICDQCPNAEENQSGGRCAREVLAASIAPLTSPGPMGTDLRRSVSEQKPRRALRVQTDGRMGLGVSGQPTQIAQDGAKHGVADLGPRSRHRASRHGHRTLVAQRSQRYLRPVRPTRYAYRRPRGLFAPLFGW